MGSGPSTSGIDQAQGQLQAGATNLQNLAMNPNLQALSQGQLTDQEKLAMQQQMNMIRQGEQGIVQGARDLSTQRGLFSSSGAIQDELLASNQVQGQLASLYGQQAQMQRQGLLQGTGLQGQLLGQALQGQQAAMAGAQSQYQANQQKNDILGNSIGTVASAGFNLLCFLGDVKIKMSDGTLKQAKDIKIGDECLEGGKVLATAVSAVPEIVYELDGVRASGGHALCVDGEWMRLYQVKGAEKIGHLDEYRYPIVNENHRLITENGQVWADYAEVEETHGVTDDDRIEILNGRK